MKNSKGGLSTFFPDSWSKQRLQEELSLAFKHKIFKGGNKYEGIMSDGVTVRFHINNGVVDSAYPVF